MSSDQLDDANVDAVAKFGGTDLADARLYEAIGLPHSQYRRPMAG